VKSERGILSFVFASERLNHTARISVHKIEQAYFLSVAAPVALDSGGRRWCNELWAKDLALHLEYIDHLIVGCPCESREPNEFDVAMDQPPFNRVRFIDFPNSKNHLEALLSLPSLPIPQFPTS
jgi:hypothetical protein